MARMIGADMFFEGNYSASYFEVLPDFVMLAESFGAKGLKLIGQIN